MLFNVVMCGSCSGVCSSCSGMYMWYMCWCV